MPKARKTTGDDGGDGASGNDSAPPARKRVRVNEAELDAEATVEIARHWFREQNWLRLQAMLDDLDTLGLLIDRTRRSEVLRWWLALEDATGRAIEDLGEEAWRRWNPDLSRESSKWKARHLAVDLVSMFTEAERWGEFTERLVRLAMQVDIEEEGERCQQVVRHLDMLALLHRKRGDLIRAEDYCRQAIALSETVEGEESWRTALEFNALAAVFRARGDYPEALRLYRRALMIVDALEDVLSPDVLFLLSNISSAYEESGERVGAEPYTRRIIAILEAREQRDVLELCCHLSDHADQLEAMNDLPAAMSERRRALALAEQQSGPEHPRAIVHAKELACALTEQGEWGEGGALLRRVLAHVDEQPAAPDDLRLCTLMELSRVEAHAGRWVEAAALLMRAQAMLDDPEHKPEDPEVRMSVLQVLGVALRQSGRLAEARHYLGRAMQAALECVEDRPHLLAKVLSAIGKLRLMEGKRVQAMVLFGRSLAIRRTYLRCGDEEIGLVEGRLRAAGEGGAVDCEAGETE